MPGLFSPKLSILSSWESTLAVAFQTFRRVKFVIEDTFQFGNFDPQTVYSGTTASSYNIYRARYLKLNKLAWVSLDITGIPAIGTPNIIVTLPFNVAGDGTIRQGGAAALQNGGLPENGQWVSAQAVGPNKLSFFRLPAVTNFTGAGITRITLNTFLEVA